jgi:hypothetical protein
MGQPAMEADAPAIQVEEFVPVTRRRVPEEDALAAEEAVDQTPGDRRVSKSSETGSRKPGNTS